MLVLLLQWAGGLKLHEAEVDGVAGHAVAGIPLDLLAGGGGFTLFDTSFSASHCSVECDQIVGAVITRRVRDFNSVHQTSYSEESAKQMVTKQQASARAYTHDNVM